MPAQSGKDAVVEYAIGTADDSPEGLTWRVLGMMRRKSMNLSWDTADRTGDSSPPATKSNLATFRQLEFDGDGVSYTDEVHNQALFKAHVINPGEVTGYQPSVWFRMTDADGSYYRGPFLVVEWADERPHDGVATWGMRAISNGLFSWVAGGGYAAEDYFAEDYVE